MYRLKELRESRNMTQAELGRILKIAPSTIGMYEQGRREPDNETLKRLSTLFDVSTDYLLDNQTSKKDSLPSLNAKDEREITRMMDDMKDRLMQEEGLMFDGQPASPESIQSILDAMQIGMEMAKKRNKAKYTPKKYRPEG